MANLDAVMWDFGGVFSPSPFSAIAALGKEKGIDGDLFFDAIFGPYDGDTDHPWHRLERGEIDFMTAREGIIELSKSKGFEADPIELFSSMGKGGGMREEVIDLAARIKSAGFRTAIVTNNIKEFRERWVASVPIDAICHEIIDSSEVGVRKPDARIFEIALEQLGGIAPERTLFVDDFQGNIDAAEALGIQCVLMQDDYHRAIAEIEALTL